MDAIEFLKTFNIPDNSELKALEPNNGPLYHLVKYLKIQKPVVSEEVFWDFFNLFKVLD
jgi:hypothetical protein